MPSNVQLNPGSGGAIIRTDDIGGIETPVSKLQLGGVGVDGGFVSATNPLPAYLSPVTSLAYYGTTTLVPANSETTVSSYTVPGGTTLLLSGFVGGGDCNGRFNVYVDTTQILTGRNTVAQQTVAVPLFTPYQVQAGQTVRVKFIHSNAGISANLEATITGNLI